ncbi:MAG: D-tyrosyl-tRNA(Tyr) deacylase [Hymenobacteraceae bacterium]|nr:D-tyrosyl-tRNA(Tyr) deacylase [Hymenobacteraceae bacterium]MDX5395804.1 D-tyrosyl-tRNA(Tyr) deacylase [Hymenobacteraceae bacterium]MDX5442943.1 D-tyrosyl-tRNA(Tyr) deacylase [Hymenobacteraceae bacterium]MDX5511859.1 D-tyrosyl-tRNA(Tyr) deacylase [Hymenobacteraceae bacterium]
MRAVIQRVKEASVEINEQVKGKIETGLLVLLGVAPDDTGEDMQWLAKKLVQLRIFADEEGKMNKSVQDVNGNILLISQFTLFASTRKGNRPSYTQSAPPAIAIPLYEQFITVLETAFGKKVETGEFGADMQVKLQNDGPVTIIIDTKNRE